jgi:hypothetical protein
MYMVGSEVVVAVAVNEIEDVPAERPVATRFPPPPRVKPDWVASMPTDPPPVGMVTVKVKLAGVEVLIVSHVVTDAENDTNVAAPEVVAHSPVRPWPLVSPHVPDIEPPGAIVPV